MSIRLMEDEVGRFLSDTTPEVLAIKGRWGVGKTYQWNALLTKNKHSVGLPRYAYVSLFGIDSLGELKSQIFQQTQAVEDLEHRPDTESFLGRAKDAWKTHWRKVEAVKDVPVFQQFLPRLESVALLAIKDTVVCIDDIERKGSNLDIRDVMGLVSALKEQRGCKVALIFNDEYLEQIGSSEYQTYREKVVDVELRFAPEPSEAAAIALKETPDLLGRTMDGIVKLGIGNIRILKKIQRTASQLLPLLSEFEAEVSDSALKTVLLLTWCYYSRGNKDVPSFEYVKGATEHTSLYGFVDGDKLPDEQKQWNALLQDYGYTHTDELDRQIALAIETGFVDAPSLIEKAKILDAQWKNAKSEGSFSEAWRLYHDSFNNNEEDVVNGLYESFRRNVKHISPVNLNGTVRLFKELGRDKLAEEIIQIYVEERKDEQALFDLDDYAFADDLSEESVREAFIKAHKEVGDKKTLREVIRSIAGRSGWDPRDESVLADASVDEYYEVFKTESGEHLRSYVNAALRFGRFDNASDKHKKIGGKAEAALKRIASESEINKRRVRKFGVVLEEEKPVD